MDCGFRDWRAEATLVRKCTLLPQPDIQVLIRKELSTALTAEAEFIH